MDEETLREIEKRAKAATPGPWESHDTEDGNWFVSMPDDGKATKLHLWFGDMEIVEGQDLHNADFIARAREDVPALIAEVRRLLWRVRDLQTQREQDLAARRGELTRGPWTP